METVVTHVSWKAQKNCEWQEQEGGWSIFNGGFWFSSECVH